MQPCSPANVKVSFHVLELTQESYVQVNSMPYDFVLSMYNFDVRRDSSRLRTDTALQPCLTGKVIEFCKLQPGIYTLVIYGSSVYSSSCISITPVIYVDKVGYSRFDHANNAYDFGSIAPDSTWKDRKPGDVNPLDATRTPSNDFFYCTTGAQPLDPDLAACMSKYNPNIYKAGNNIVLHPDNATAPDNYTIDRRNLWYTFTVQHAGKVRVRVKNKTPDKTHQQPFAVYKSDVDGTLPFTQVVANGLVDSTLAQGLTYVTRNHSGGQPYGFCNGLDELEFFIPPCLFTPTRYYIMVENRNPYNYGEVHDMRPNSQVEVSVLFDSISANPPKFDHYSQANDLGVVNSGIKKGAVDNFTCATRDLPDPLYAYTSCQKTLWYKFTTTTTGQIRYAAFFKNSNQWYYDHIQLFRQVQPNDSSATGLQHMPYTTSYNNTGQWAQQCITPGTYYIILPGCNAIDEDVYPQIEIIPQAGDFCSAPVVSTLNGPGSKVSSVTVDCHTIGTDYGEFNTTLTCPANVATNSYKSSWYRLDITGKDTLDVTVYLNENTLATSTDIKYRMMTGTCGAMQEQSCVQDALTRNTYKCLAPGNSYYIQVFTPIAYFGQPVTGTIDLNINAVIHADTCLPASNCIGVANFTAAFDCTKDKEVKFTNLSTYGSSITYNWDFGYNNQKSTSVSPTFFYPALSTAATYSVKLIITNMVCGKMDSAFQTITIPPRPGVNLGKDIVSCTTGITILLDATSHPGSTYYWYNGSTQPNIAIGGIASPYVEVTYAGCKARDTINIWINPIAKRGLQTKALCTVTTVLLDANRGYGEQFSWSTGANTNSIIVAQPGYYWADVYLNGCTIRDSFYVVNTNLRPLGNDTVVCQRNMPFTADAMVNGASGYLWQNNTTSPTRTITQPGLYWVDISLGGCTFRDTLLVKVDSFKTANIIARICNGNTYRLPSGRQVQTAGVYQDTLYKANGCDSLITQVNLTVQNVIRATITHSICAGQSYTLPSGTRVTTPGNYADTIRYVSGCDSLITSVNLSVKSLIKNTTNVAIGQGQSYTLPSGKIVTAGGTYSDTVRYAAGCDSLISTISLSVNPYNTFTSSITICQGNNFTLPSGKLVNTAGLYRDTVKYVSGFDSLISVINLTVNSLTRTTLSVSICAGQSYKFPSGKVVGQAGVYIDTIRYVGQCDSLYSTITVSVKPLLKQTVNPVICAGGNYTLPSGKVVNTTGVYSDTVRYASGCDSLINTVNLIVNAVARVSITWAICEGSNYIFPSGKVISTTGVFTDTLSYTNGCDSLISTLTLSVKKTTRTTVNAAICAGQSYTLPSGSTVTLPGNYMDTVKYRNGCDSLISTINLTVSAVVRQSLNPVICSGASYQMPSGRVITTTGLYNDTIRYASGCDSVVTTINLNVKAVKTFTLSPRVCNGQTYALPGGKIVNATGVYQDTLKYTTGCDSIHYTINLSVLTLTRTALSATVCAGQVYSLPSGKTVNSKGVFIDTVKYSNGCDSLITTVTITLKTAVRSTIDPIICAGALYVLPSGKSINTTGVYSDTLRYVSGCDSVITSVNLKVLNVRQAAVSAQICQGETWLLPSGKSVFVTGVYADTLRYKTGCDSLITIVNLFVTSPVTQVLYAEICSGETYRLPSGRLVNSSGNFTDIVKNSKGCDSMITNLWLTVNPLPVVTISKSNDINCILGSATLTATGGVRYAWSPITYLNNALVSKPVATPVTTTIYKAKVTSAKGCVAENSIELKVSKDNIDGGYLLPSGFTPNADGKNDCFGVKSWGLISNLQFSIFDRWGILVFSTTDPSKCWDGTHDNIQLSTGAFVYSASAITLCGPVLRKGTVVLIR